MRVIVSGGGTGGHIYPALSIAGALAGRGAEIIYMGSLVAPDGVHEAPEKAIALQAGYRYLGVPAAGLRKKSPKIIKDLMVNHRGIKMAAGYIRDLSPDIVIGCGGFATAPVLKAAQKQHIPTMIHEQNAFPGLANRYLAAKANAVCLTFADASKYFPHQDRLHITGLPVRKQVLNATKEEGYEYFHIPQEKRCLPTLLVTGGSQGARTINEAMRKAWQPLLEQGIRIIHLCGKKNYDELKKSAPEHENFYLLPYLEQMEKALAIADMAVARSGASFLAEICCLGIPALLVPFPYAANDHQTANAKAMKDKQAAILVKDNMLTPKVICDQVIPIIKDPAQRQMMSKAAMELSCPNAADMIADIAQDLVKK